MDRKFSKLLRRIIAFTLAFVMSLSSGNLAMMATAAPQAATPDNDPVDFGVTVTAGSGINFTAEHDDPSLFISNVYADKYVEFAISGTEANDYFEYEYDTAVAVSSVRLVRVAPGNEITGMKFRYESSPGVWTDCGEKIGIETDNAGSTDRVWGVESYGGRTQVTYFPTSGAAASKKFRIYVTSVNGTEAKMRLLKPQFTGGQSLAPLPVEVTLNSVPAGEFKITSGSLNNIYNNPELGDILADDTDASGGGNAGVTSHTVPEEEEDSFIFRYDTAVKFTGVRLVTKSAATRSIKKLALYVSDDGTDWGSALTLSAGGSDGKTVQWFQSTTAGTGKHEEVLVPLAAPAEGKYMKVKILEFAKQWGSFFVTEVAPTADVIVVDQKSELDEAITDANSLISTIGTNTGSGIGQYPPDKVTALTDALNSAKEAQSGYNANSNASLKLIMRALSTLTKAIEEAVPNMMKDILPHPVLTLEGVAPAEGNISDWVVASGYKHNPDGSLVIPLEKNSDTEYSRAGLMASTYNQGWVVYDYRGAVEISEVYMVG